MSQSVADHVDISVVALVAVVVLLATVAVNYEVGRFHLGVLGGVVGCVAVHQLVGLYTSD